MVRRALSALAPYVLLALWISPVEIVAQPDPEVEAALVRGNDELTQDLLERLGETPGNLAFSPHSVRLALAMVLEGAEGASEARLREILRIPEATPDDAFRDLAERLQPSALSLRVATSCFADLGDPPSSAFVARVRHKYGAGYEEMDFGRSEDARDRIHAWISEATEGRIRTLLDSGPDRSTPLVAASAIFFDAKWRTRFPPPKPSRFRPLRGPAVDSVALKAILHVPYGETPTAKVVDVPYAGGEAVLSLALPNELADPTRLGPDVWKTPRRLQRVLFEMPPFRIESKVDLAEVLLRDEAPSTAAPSSDFRGLVTSSPLFLPDVLHAVLVDVNEKGTTAAAVTAVIVTRGGGGSDDEWDQAFVADRPFLFRIVHRATGLVLFAGRVSEV
jgi:serpin B